MDPSLVENTFAAPSWCTELIRSELLPYGLALPYDLIVKLELSAGKLGEQTVYRPYAVMAGLLGRAKNDKHLNEGEGAKFRDADKTIAAWLGEQAGIDASLGLTLPAVPFSGRLSKGSFSVRNVLDLT